MVECDTEFVSDLFPARPIVSHVVLRSLLLDHSFNLSEEILFIVYIVNLIHLWQSVSYQLVLETERHGDGNTGAHTDWFLFATWQICEVNIDLCPGELNELVKRAYNVPPSFVDLGHINILG